LITLRRMLAQLLSASFAINAKDAERFCNLNQEIAASSAHMLIPSARHNKHALFKSEQDRRHTPIDCSRDWRNRDWVRRGHAVDPYSPTRLAGSGRDLQHCSGLVGDYSPKCSRVSDSGALIRSVGPYPRGPAAYSFMVDRVR
jgi:hypothetical protein